MKRLYVLMFAGIMAMEAGAQKKSPVVLKIQDQNFMLDEFEYVYNKNNQLSQTPLSSKEYLDLFVNYKLKVTDAVQKGYDTTQTFQNEFSYYRDELSKPYLNDKKTEDNLAQEAYQRLLNEVDASHIMVRLPQMPTPQDTLAAYNKAKGILERVRKGDAFDELAFQLSEDPSAKQNRGRLGYFSGFQMVYPFESAAYRTPVGQVSDIVRSQFGYHIIKVHDKRPAGGEILTAHIMKMFPVDAPETVKESAKKTIDSLYVLVLDGADFGTLARENSDDRNSAMNNGELPWFNTGRMIPEFAQPAFALAENGQVSKPIQTPFGWHIIKRLDHRPVASFDDMKEEIYQRIAHDERAFAGQNAVLERIKAETDFVANKANLEPIKSLVGQEGMTDSVFFATSPKQNLPVCSFAKQIRTQQQFIGYLKAQPSFSVGRGTGEIDQHFDNYCKNELLAYEKTQLAKKYPEYRYLVSEYHDGLLIFDISQKEVWNKAAADTTGLDLFFADNRQRYPKPEQWDGVIYYCNDQATYDKLKSVLSTDTAVNDSIISGFGLSSTEVKTEKGKFAKGEKAIVDANFFNEANANVVYPSGFTKALIIGKINPASIYGLDEIRGQVLSDYQTELEKRWVESLKAKYSPKINYKALKKIKTQ
ncbi:MAG: peptidylprolyl isomerase [Breznakibacter sp.]